MEINWKLIDSEIRGSKLTNKKIAELLGIGLATFNRYRSGQSDIPLKIFYKLLEILDLQYDDVIIDSEVVEYRKYFKEAKYLSMDEMEKRIHKIDDIVAILEEFKTEKELKNYEQLMELFGEERFLKVAKGYIEYNKLQDKMYD